jgi:anti-sigma28 factor (negative regulator of flagellin synthesis)
MKIPRADSKPTSALNPSAGVGAKGTSSSSTQPAGPGRASDRVQLSSLSSYILAALSGSPAHIAKLNALGAAVSSGKYSVDASQVSASIIQHSIEFGGAPYSALST